MTAPVDELDIILFDLDNTLYHPDCGLLEAGDRRITRFIARRLGLDREEADRLRLRTWREYGATARGLEIEHGVPQREFFAAVIERVEVEDYLRPDPDLAAMLGRLPQHLYVFTNATARYAGRVLAALAVAEHFERIFDIEFAGGVPKPAAEGYERIVRELQTPPGRMALIEDTEPNLAPAAERGMLTIKVGSPPVDDRHVALPELLRLPELFGL